MRTPHKKPKAAGSKKQTPDYEEVQAGSEDGTEDGPGFPIVGIGASAGGLAAFETFFRGCPQTNIPAFVLAPKEAEVRTQTGRHYTVHIRPCRWMDNVIEGAVIWFIDITEMVRNYGAGEWRGCQSSMVPKDNHPPAPPSLDYLNIQLLVRWFMA